MVELEEVNPTLLQLLVLNVTMLSACMNGGRETAFRMVGFWHEVCMAWSGKATPKKQNDANTIIMD